MQIPAELEIARGLPPLDCPVAEAERYTRWLATHHYENFNVASWLLPRRLHQHFYNLYAYCRWADDLGDEITDPALSLELLDGWDQELRGCYGMRRPARVTAAQFLVPTVQQLERERGIGDFISEVVGPAAVCVQIVKMLMEALGKQPRGHIEILVMVRGEPTRVLFGVGNRTAKRRQSTSDFEFSRNLHGVRPAAGNP